jgi:hypothetical protein
MSQDPSVVIKSQVVQQSTARPYLNRGCVTFRPSTTAFLNGFIALAGFKDPGTGDGLVAELTINNYASTLRAMGAQEDEPIWQFVKGMYTQEPQRAANGTIVPITRPPSIFIGRRTSAVVSRQTIDFTTATAGRVTITVNPSRFLFASGALASVTITADGVKSDNDLRDEAFAALNAIPGFAAVFLAAAAVPDGQFTITSLSPGYPLIVKVTSTTGGPVMTNTVTTANVANAYRDDLIEIVTASEDQDDPITGKPERRFFFITDLQGDKVVNAEGYAYVQARRALTVPVDYQFHGLSRDPLNFDPTSAGTSEAEIAAAANGGQGWNYGAVMAYDLYDNFVANIWGMTIGNLPGSTMFASRVLYGSTPESRCQPRNQGENASLATTRRFNYYSPEGARGQTFNSFTSDGAHIDQDWLAQYARHLATEALIRWKGERSIISFLDEDIAAGAEVITFALLKLPVFARLADELIVEAVPVSQLSANAIAGRVYLGYSVSAVSGGVIERFGAIGDPILISISESV